MKRIPSAILDDDQQRQSDAAAAYVMDCSDKGLYAHFHRARVLGGALAVAAGIGAIMLVLHGDGVTIESFIESDKSDEEVKDLVDNYNSISGSIGSFISKPVELFLGLLVSAAFLCFATDFTLDKGSIGHWQYIPVLTGAAIAYLFGNGLNALNVQVVTGPIYPRMTIDDLRMPVNVNSQPISPNGSFPTPWDRAYLENASGNPMLNTIMNTKIMPIQSVSAVCKSLGFNVALPLNAMTVVAFGFPSRSWQSEVFMEAQAPVKTLMISMSKSVNDLPSESALPSSVSITRGLVNVGYRVLGDLNIGTNETNAPVVLANVSFMSAAHTTWLSVLNATKSTLVKDATIEYSRFQLSEKVTYDAMTIELPVPVVQRDRFGAVINQVDGFNEILVEDSCGRDGCVIPPAETVRINKTSTVQSRVQATSICVKEDGSEEDVYSMPPCMRMSKTSMRIVSIGKRVEGDVWDMANKTDGPTMRFKSLRTVYSITVARIAWEVEDVAKKFQAQCDNDSDPEGCVGLRHKLQPRSSDYQSDYLAVAKSSLPILDLNEYTSTGYDKWVYLVTGADGLGEQHYDVLRPRNFATITAAGGALRRIAVDECNTFSDDYIRAVERNHLYMEHSLQVSYTAAFFYLFQNAVPARRRLVGVSTTSANGKTSSVTTTKLSDNDEMILAFAGNQQVMDVVVSVPTTNALVSLAGCLIVLVVSIGVVVSAKKSEQQLQVRANAEIVVEAMMNSSKYPPWLLDMALERAAAMHTQQQQRQQQQNPLPLQEETTRFVLQDLRVQSANLQHRKDAQHELFVGSETYKA